MFECVAVKCMKQVSQCHNAKVVRSRRSSEHARPSRASPVLVVFYCVNSERDLIFAVAEGKLISAKPLVLNAHVVDLIESETRASSFTSATNCGVR
ncbi:hypothetical protein EVAR_89163_1 [Eumeta japonica]|uniref:Uncharacterized protein n=1 Tax=Eumeta variegata TaxID=151549 RepID=A0A4C1Z7W8_EUMVA|nr:hypothetical protein EVAR_89163_1 [Eumeta japonica]